MAETLEEMSDRLFQANITFDELVKMYYDILRENKILKKAFKDSLFDCDYPDIVEWKTLEDAEKELQKEGEIV
jgi:hypothetical protein